ncbi:MAG: hypothetical protein UR26_C0003G0133 [candidate division TM6 bacterium GW2011_GWF2_32_72]|nr:MAG: hypothetical protein UR26_C0003G0133 [candidate division TM6 bacterium GW2011_GWF2_32_72]
MKKLFLFCLLALSLTTQQAHAESGLLDLIGFVIQIGEKRARQDRNEIELIKALPENERAAAIQELREKQAARSSRDVKIILGTGAVIAVGIGALLIFVSSSK